MLYGNVRSDDEFQRIETLRWQFCVVIARTLLLITYGDKRCKLKILVYLCFVIVRTRFSLAMSSERTECTILYHVSCLILSARTLCWFQRVKN